MHTLFIHNEFKLCGKRNHASHIDCGTLPNMVSFRHHRPLGNVGKCTLKLFKSMHTEIYTDTLCHI